MSKIYNYNNTTSDIFMIFDCVYALMQNLAIHSLLLIVSLILINSELLMLLLVGDSFLPIFSLLSIISSVLWWQFRKMFSHKMVFLNQSKSEENLDGDVALLEHQSNGYDRSNEELILFGLVPGVDARKQIEAAVNTLYEIQQGSELWDMQIFKALKIPPTASPRITHDIESAKSIVHLRYSGLISMYRWEVELEETDNIWQCDLYLHTASNDKLFVSTGNSAHPPAAILQSMLKRELSFN